MTESEIFDRADFYSASDDLSELRFTQTREVIDDIHSHTLGPHEGCTIYAWTRVPATLKYHYERVAERDYSAEEVRAIAGESK